MKTHCTTVMTDNLLNTQDANIHTFNGRFFSPQGVIVSMCSLCVERDDCMQRDLRTHQR